MISNLLTCKNLMQHIHCTLKICYIVITDNNFQHSTHLLSHLYIGSIFILFQISPIKDITWNKILWYFFTKYDFLTRNTIKKKSSKPFAPVNTQKHCISNSLKYNASLHFLYRHVDIITLLSCTLSGSDCIYQKRSQQFIHALLTSYIIHFIYFAASQTSFPSLNTISFIS